MSAVLPLVALAFLYGISLQRSNCWRSSVLSAAVQWGILLTSITELLSLGRLLTFGWLVGAWAISDVSLIYIYVHLAQKLSRGIKKNTSINLSPFLAVLLCGIAIIVFAVGLIASIAPPNNWDSMSYHMARVVHWIQNRSVAHYPTNYTPQLFIGPWAGFAITHLQILTGGDRLANLVQWSGMVGSILGVSLIAKQLGADVRGQIFSAVVCATIPMGILQGSSTQTDYVVTFWLVCFVYFVLTAISKGAGNSNVFNIGGSLGLAILSKQIAYIYAFPAFVCFLILTIKKHGWKTWKIVLPIALLMLLINLGHYGRNLDLFHSPFGDPSWPYTNEVFSLPTFISNVIRNISLHIGLPPLSSVPQVFTYSVRDLIDGGIRLIHAVLQVDINDPRTTWGQFTLPYLSFHEDSAGNFVHLLLLLFAIVLCLTLRCLRRQQDLVIYLALTVSAFLLFCFLLKWTPWHSRLHLPLFVLASAFVGVVISRIPSCKLVNFIVIFLLLSALPFVFFNQTRPLIAKDLLLKGGIANIFNTSRIDQYFSNRPDLREPYLEAAEFVKTKACSSVGLLLGKGGDWEYPFWVLLRAGETRETHIEQIGIKNVSVVKSTIHPYVDFSPCAIISVKPTYGREEIAQEGVGGKRRFVQEWSLGSVRVYTADRMLH